MNDRSKLQYEAHSQELRAQLKTWENQWAKNHGGSKPSREDIKQNTEIAQKYKQYQKIRDILSGKIPPGELPDDRKRKQPEAVPPTTPSKRPRAAQTPRRSSTQIAPADLPGPPAEITTPTINRQLFSPAQPTSIGPTPQKDGRVLGLFDLLGRTPSRLTWDSNSVPVASTPRRRRDSDADPAPTATTPRQLGRTPVTSGRYIQLAGFTTPLRDRQGNGLTRRTPSSSGRVSKPQFSTPAFLRRSAVPMPPVDENGEWDVAPLRLPKKPMVRSLSNIVAGLRRLEEETLDEELDVLHEIEMEEEGRVAKMSAPAAIPTSGREKTSQDGDAEVEDSQAVAVRVKHEKPVLLGGFDEENLYDSSDEEQLERGRHLRKFKKKGQKRTTRLANLKPTRAKQPSASVDCAEGSDDEVVPETQFDTTKATGDPEDDLEPPMSGSDFDYSAFSDDDGDASKKKARKPSGNRKSTAAKAGKSKDEGKEEAPGVVRKAVRKVKATAHANFKRLKLRNTGSKGGPAHNSRFKRRR